MRCVENIRDDRVNRFELEDYGKFRSPVTVPFACKYSGPWKKADSVIRGFLGNLDTVACLFPISLLRPVVHFLPTFQPIGEGANYVCTYWKEL